MPLLRETLSSSSPYTAEFAPPPSGLFWSGGRCQEPWGGEGRRTLKKASHCGKNLRNKTTHLYSAKKVFFSSLRECVCLRWPAAAWRTGARGPRKTETEWGKRGEGEQIFSRLLLMSLRVPFPVRPAPPRSHTAPSPPLGGFPSQKTFGSSSSSHSLGDDLRIWWDLISGSPENFSTLIFRDVVNCYLAQEIAFSFLKKKKSEPPLRSRSYLSTVPPNPICLIYIFSRAPQCSPPRFRGRMAFWNINNPVR